MSQIILCSIDGCNKTIKARGWCGMHYIRWQRHGDPVGGETFAGQPFAFVKQLIDTRDGHGCVTWPYATCKGYGKFLRPSDQKLVIVHRYICEAVQGPPPTDKHEAAHSCGRGDEGCCAPWHLSWKTRTENMLDKVKHGTVVKGEDHPATTLTESQVLAIFVDTRSQSVIGEHYGISRGSVSDIKRGNSWSWLTQSASL